MKIYTLTLDNKDVFKIAAEDADDAISVAIEFDIIDNPLDYATVDLSGWTDFFNPDVKGLVCKLLETQQFCVTDVFGDDHLFGEAIHVDLDHGKITANGFEPRVKEKFEF